MKGRMYFKVMSLVIILTGVLVVSMNATAQTTAQMTPFEKKLYESALKEGRFEWWDSFNLKESSAFIKEFNNKYPGIKVEYYEATSDVREEKYLAEHSAGRKTLDFTSINLYDKFKDQNLLLDISDIVKDTKYPTKFCTKELLAVAVEHAIQGTAYNTKLVSPKDVPRSWEDLLDPKWKGRKIAVEDRFKLFLYITPYWGQEKTVKYLKMLGEQKPIFAKGGTQTITLLSTGEFPIAIGMTLHGTLRDKAKGAPVDFAPISPAVHQLSTWAVMREAPHPNAAKLFLRWWMTLEGQLFTDKLRLKGNPVPGSQTSQSKIIEQMGIEIYSSPVWEVESIKGIEELYGDAIGLKKK